MTLPLGHLGWICSRSGEGVSELREAIVGFTIHSRGYKEALPGMWIHLKEKLLQLQQGGQVWLPTGKYKSIARDCGVDGVNMVVATRFLHETGAIRFFGDASNILNIEDHDFDEFVRTSSAAVDMLEHTVFISAPWMVMWPRSRSNLAQFDSSCRDYKHKQFQLGMRLGTG